MMSHRLIENCTRREYLVPLSRVRTMRRLAVITQSFGRNHVFPTQTQTKVRPLGLAKSRLAIVEAHRWNSCLTLAALITASHHTSRRLRFRVLVPKVFLRQRNLVEHTAQFFFASQFWYQGRGHTEREQCGSLWGQAGGACDGCMERERP
jgi:hypothetical protein